MLLLALAAFAKLTPSIYFDLGADLTEQFRGTYEFKHKEVHFVRRPDGTYNVNVSGDQSPSADTLLIKNGYILWVLGHSGEKWVVIKNTLKDGDEWENHLRGWNQRYRVVATDASVTVPAGAFQHCAKIEVSWTAHEPDMRGPQKVVLYLAPRLGIIKREEWSGDKKWHEEVLTQYAAR